MKTQNLIFTILIFIFLGCQKPIPEQNKWTGTITIAENKSLTFQMYLDFKSSPPTGCFLNGTEQTQIPEIYFNDDSLSFIFSEYNAAMLGIWNGNEWKGKFFRYRVDTNFNIFTASPFSSKENNSLLNQSDILLKGKFHALIHNPNGIDSTTIASFWIKNDSIYGTLIAPDGDYGLLVGTQIGNKATLFRFTGWQAFVMELEKADDLWRGKLFSRSGEPMEFSLKPLNKMQVSPKLERTTSIKNSNAPFSFYGITTSGLPISHTDEIFKNKALIIDIMGTWCHNCMDATPLLQELYSKFNKDGLEVIGLAFEISDDINIAKKNLSLFKKRYGITYNLIFCGSTKGENVNTKLRSQLDNFMGYPTTLFVDRKGSVKEIHVGFKGPGTGDEYAQQVKQYYNSVKKILD